jgi:diguanylate cyclase (GGDEF)-like protein
VGLTARFAIVLLTAVLVLGALGWTGLAALSSASGSLNSIYRGNVTDQQTAANLRGSLDDAEELILRGWVTPTTRERARLASVLKSRVIPAVELGIATANQLASDNPKQAKVALDLTADWGSFKALWSQAHWGKGSSASRAAHAPAVIRSLDGLNAGAAAITRIETIEEVARYHEAVANERSNRRTMIVALVIGLAASLAIVVWLIRAILRPILRYSRFAGGIARGDYGARLEPTGNDEIDQLGRTLDEVAERRLRAEEYDRKQLEFSDSLQLTEDERDAQDLLRRHLERSIPESAVTVFNRNNSAARLEAVTPVAVDPPLQTVLRHASPRDCLAVRSAASHTETPESEPLLACGLCGALPGSSTCTPLLVGGEVIGSVLVKHEAALGGDASQHIRESVKQAAPVIANLRNLAIAQRRASTDSLTGLPNRRALDDMLKRMVAESRRNELPLAALMLDLDHFKRINDDLGHSKGDELLAAVGAALQHVLRATDFAARYGGEEFLVLLPATDVQGALTTAEKIRTATEKIELPGEQIDLTVSIGVAALPDHAIDGEQLQRAADRALYLAKNNGRDRVEVASGPSDAAREPLAAPASANGAPAGAVGLLS